jgi:hypothetical protein
MSLEYNKSPYEIIPEELKNEYTMNGKIPIFNWYIDSTAPNGVEWSNSLINSYMNRFTPENIRNNCEDSSAQYGNEVCVNLLNSFEDYNIRNKNVAVIGSTSPWIEAILLNMSNKVTTIEYNVPDCINSSSNDPPEISYCLTILHNTNKT